MKVYERLAEAFAAEGVTGVFGMMGHGNEAWMDALDKLGVAIYEVRHEGTGLGMADGWARVGREVGVASATQGPGLSQLATALLTASRASSPVVAFVGEHGANDYDHHQYLDQSRFAAACESGFVRVSSAAGADEAVRKAFYQARTELRPVVLSAPGDVQPLEFPGSGDYRPTTALLPDRVAYPIPHQIQAAADLIARSRRPVIVVGRGARWANAGDAVRTLASTIGALINTSLMAVTWLADDEYHAGISGGYSTKAAAKLCAEADCVIGVGASLNKHTVQRGKLYPNAAYVHIDERPHLPVGEGRSADCYVHADAKLGVEALIEELEQRGFSNEGFRTPDVKAQLEGSHIDDTEYEIEDGLLDPRDVVRTLDEILPGDIAIATGSGAQAGFSTMGFVRPRTYSLAATFYGCIGQMLPAAMGAAAFTGKPIVVVDGDASVLMHLIDFDSAARYGWPVLVVVQNNEGLGSEYYTLQSKGMKTDLALIPSPDLGQVATSLGGRGRLVRTVEELTDAVKGWVADPVPTVIDARISRNPVSLVMRRKRGEDV